MSATPIPRTMMMSLYGDMDISKITEKPDTKKKNYNLSKPEKKISEIWPFIKKEIKKKSNILGLSFNRRVKFLDYASAKKKFDIINKQFPNKVGINTWIIEKEKKKCFKKFLNKEIFIY